MEKITYQGWPNCYRLANSHVELIVTTDVGPRIIRYGFIDQPNEFKEYPEMLGKIGGDEWRIYGGHRLWHAPEIHERTYRPDNDPVEIQALDANSIRLTQVTEAATGIQKEIDIWLSPDSPEVKLTHRFINHNLWDIELSMWALSVMAAGGKAIVPLPPRGSHDANLLPSSLVAIWSYTNMSDARWTWGEKYIFLQQTPNPSSQKIGVLCPDGWLGYTRNNHLFVKTFEPVPHAPHPDRGSNIEVYTDGAMLELETLGPLTTIKSRGTLTHNEAWYLFDGVATPANDADVEATILPLVQSIR